MTFLLSIEPTEGETFVEKFHLGTDERIARKEAETRFHGRNRAGMATRTVALINAETRRVFDVFDGYWINLQGWGE
ncbi:hypothetical protein RCXUPER_238 [Rhodobacter phage RcXuper]|nr:hypothetical protein RCXUPER_238 [Rhodobacter phage RcXuper]